MRSPPKALWVSPAKPRGIVPKIGAEEDLALGQRQWLADLQRLTQGQLIGPRHDALGHAAHDLAPLRRAHLGPRPGVKRMPRRSNGRSAILRPACGPLAGPRSGMGRALALQALARGCIDRAPPMSIW
jgi:hypothetical protein